MKLSPAFTLIATAATLLFAGCGRPPASPHHLKLGVISGAEEQVGLIGRYMASRKNGKLTRRKNLANLRPTGIVRAKDSVGGLKKEQDHER